MPSAKKPAPARRVTLRELARHLGVSVATVSNAYNRPDQLSAQLRQKVLDAAQELGYHGPDPLARSLRRGKTGVVGVVYDAPLEYAFADPAAALFLGSVAHAIQGEGLSVLLLASPPDIHPDARPVRTASVDGFIVYAAAQRSALLDAVQERGLPTVLVDHLPAPPAAQVGIDDAGGARQAAEYLLELGHRHIGVISLSLNSTSPGGPITPARAQRTAYHATAQRLKGYREGATGATLYPTEAKQNTPAEGERRTAELLTAHPQITALLCMSDVLAQGALRAAAEWGMQVPHDLSIVGYDDVPLSEVLNLTTVWQPTAEKGQRAGEALLALMQQETAAAGQALDVKLPTRLVVRGSTASCPT